MNTSSPSLYDRLGGADLITALIPTFYEQMLKDPELAPFFAHAALDKLQAMQREFISMALGGPIEYTGRPLAHAHHGRGISRSHLAKFTGHLLESLKALGVGDAEADEVIARVNASSNEIIGTSY
jgi:hemoglobin